MKKTHIIYPITIAFILICISSCSLFRSSQVDDSITLKYKLNPGQEVSITSDVSTKFESDQMGQQVTIDMNAETVIGIQALSVEPDNSLKIELEFTNMSQEMDGPMGSGETDFSEMIGKKASFQMTESGVTSEMQGFDKLPDITNVMGETVGGEVYEQVVAGTFFKLPDNPVKIGDSWTNDDSSSIPFGGGDLKTESQTTYTVVEKLKVDGDDCLRLEISGTSKTSGVFEQNGMEMSMDRNATTKGHVIFANKKGMYLSMEVSAVTEGLIDIPAAGMKIPQTIITTTTSVTEFK